MTTHSISLSVAQRWIAALRNLKGHLAANLVGQRRAASPRERYLSAAVDFADLEHRMHLVEESERRPMW
jgi:hypothetical protein